MNETKLKEITGKFLASIEQYHFDNYVEEIGAEFEKAQFDTVNSVIEEIENEINNSSHRNAHSQITGLLMKIKAIQFRTPFLI